MQIKTFVLSGVALGIIGIIFFADLNTIFCLSFLYCIPILYSWVVSKKLIYIIGSVSIVFTLFSFINNYPQNESEISHFGIYHLMSIISNLVCVFILIIAKNSLKSLNLANQNLEKNVDVRTTLLNQNITLLKNKNSQLEDSELKFRKLIEGAPDAMLIVNQKGIIILSNKQAEKVFSYEPNELQNKSIEELIPKKFRGSHPKHRERFSGSPKVRPMGEGANLRGLKKDGSEFPVEISLSPIESEGEKLVAAAIRDISERKKLEQQNRIAKEIKVRNSELEQFAYVASHDLREPLITVQNMIELVKHDFSGVLKEEGNEYLLHAEEATKRMDKLIIALLEYSIIGKNGKIESLNCNDLFKDVKANLTYKIETTGAQITVDVLPTLRGLKHELIMLFQNLISNSLKYKNPNKAPIINIDVKDIGEFWKFSFSDNGIGIDHSNLEKIFTAFQRLHSASEYEGTGIGLANCKKIVELHGGEIFAKQNEKEGLKIIFTLSKQ